MSACLCLCLRGVTFAIQCAWLQKHCYCKADAHIISDMFIYWISLGFYSPSARLITNRSMYSLCCIYSQHCPSSGNGNNAYASRRGKSFYYHCTKSSTFVFLVIVSLHTSPTVSSRCQSLLADLPVGPIICTKPVRNMKHMRYLWFRSYIATAYICSWTSFPRLVVWRPKFHKSCMAYLYEPNKYPLKVLRPRGCRKISVLNCARTWEHRRHGGTRINIFIWCSATTTTITTTTIVTHR